MGGEREQGERHQFYIVKTNTYPLTPCIFKGETRVRGERKNQYITYDVTSCE